MKHRWYKWLSLLCACAMIAALFVGCGSSDTSSSASEADSTTSTEETEEESEPGEVSEPSPEVEEPTEEEKPEEESEETEEPEESEAPEPEEPDQSLTEEQMTLLNLIPEGDILTFVDLPLTEENETLSIYISIHSTILSMYDDLSEVPFYQELEKETGVHLEFTAVPSMGEDTTLSLLVAANDLPDIGAFGSALTQGMDGAIEDGTIIDLQEYFDVMPNYSALIENSDVFRRAVTTSGGHIPGASQYTMDNTAIYRTGLMARADWIEDLGIDSPQTIDEFEQMLLLFKSEKGASAPLDMGTSGGIYTGSMVDSYGTYFSRAFGTDGGDFRLDENGNVQSGWLLDGFKEYLVEMNSWYDEGLMASDFYTAQKGMSDWTDIAGGVNGVIATHASEMEEIKAFSDEASFDLVAVADPVLNEGDELELENSFMEAAPDGGYNVAGSCSNPELACRWLDYLFSPNGWLLCNYGIEHESFEYDADGTPHWTEAITNPTDVPSGVAKSMYMIVQGPCLMYSPREFDAYTDAMIEASDIWAANIAETTYEYPNTITLVGVEAEEYNSLLSDIGTYISEVGIRFIIGERNFDEDYDEFIDTLYSMGIERMIEIKQDAYNDFVGV